MRRRSAWSQHSECAVAGATYWALRLSQVMGVAPLQFRKQRNKWRISVSATQAAMHYVIVVITALTNYLGIHFLHADVGKNRIFSMPRILVSLCAAIIVGVESTALICVYCAKSRSKGIIKCLNTVQEIKTAFHVKLQSKKAKLPSTMMMWGLTLYAFLVHFLVNNLSRTLGLRNFGSIVLISCHSFCTQYTAFKIYALTLQFICVTAEVHSALILLNDRLHSIYLSNKSRIEHKNMSDADQKTLENITEMYHSFPDMIKQLDDCFGLTVLLQIGICFLNIVVSAFFFIYSKSNEGRLIEKVTWPNTVLLDFLVLMVMMETYHGFYRERLRTRSEVGQLLCECSDEHVAEQLGKLQLCLRLSDVTASNTKLSTLSRVSVLQKCSNVATYILMIASFKDYDKTGQH